MRLHPFRWIPPEARPGVFVACAALTTILLIAFQILDRPLRTDAAPGGIVSFELAGNLAAARAIMASWGDAGKPYAALSLGLDFLFLFAYAGAIGLACMLVGRALEANAAIYRLAVLLTWLIVGAAMLDAVENLALLELLFGASDAFLPPLASLSALVKFAIVCVALTFIVSGMIALFVRRLRQSPNHPIT